MENVSILTGQLITMFLYLALGWCLQRARLVTKANVSALTNFLLYAVLPCVIVNSFVQECTPDRTVTLLWSILLGALALLAAMVVSAFCFRNNPTANFGAAFSNAGFMGIPLISAVLGNEAVFYIAGMVALLNILQWTYGQALLQASWKNCRPKEIIKNPLVISFALGLALYFLPITLPLQLQSTIRTISGCNAPIAMVILGVLLGDVSLKQLFCTPSAWCVSAIRLLVIPAVTVLALRWCGFVPETVRLALLIAASAPVGSNVAVYVQKLGQRSEEAVSMVCLSTLISAVTMPFVLMAANWIWV